MYVCTRQSQTHKCWRTFSAGIYVIIFTWKGRVYIISVTREIGWSKLTGTNSYKVRVQWKIKFYKWMTYLGHSVWSISNTLKVQWVVNRSRRFVVFLIYVLVTAMLFAKLQQTVHLWSLHISLCILYFNNFLKLKKIKQRKTLHIDFGAPVVLMWVRPS